MGIWNIFGPLSKKKEEQPFTAKEAVKLREAYLPGKTIKDAYKVIKVMAKHGHEEVALSREDYKDLDTVLEELRADGYKVTMILKGSCAMVSWQEQPTTVERPRTDTSKPFNQTIIW
jgi:hypothetical protein